LDEEEEKVKLTWLEGWWKYYSLVVEKRRCWTFLNQGCEEVTCGG